VKLLGITTTKVQLLLATSCLVTDTIQGVLTAALVLAVLALRLLVIRQHVGHEATPVQHVDATAGLTGPLS
jgi:hypothetical protein